jgi:hypothetical protein
MGNALNIELEGKFVILDKKHYQGETDLDRMFYCNCGFGCSPECNGHAIFGHFTIDAEETRIEGWQIKRLAKPEEIAQAKYPKPFTELEKQSRYLALLIQERLKIQGRIEVTEKRIQELKAKELSVKK